MSPLNEQNCQISNNRTWTCVVTLQGYNLANILVIWSVYTPNSGISISPNNGHLVTLIPTVRVTISNIPCTNTYFLFSGQVYGGGGVIPTTVPWSCAQQPTPVPTQQPTPVPTFCPTQQPTPVPTQQPTPVPTQQPSPNPNVLSLTATSGVTIVPRATPTMQLSPTPIIASGLQKNPPTMGNNSSSTEIFTTAGLTFDVVEAFVALILFAVLIKRKIFKAS